MGTRYNLLYITNALTTPLANFISLRLVLAANKPFIYGITNSTDTVPTEHLTDSTGMVKQIYGKDYEPDTDYEHVEKPIPEPTPVEKPKADDTPKPVMGNLKPKAEAKADDDEDHLEL